jgi:hypothetical protein
MAPVAGCIADAEEDRLVFGFGFLKGLGSPGIPLDWVVFVLEQVGGVLAGELVRHRVLT